ncbi:hypothetical protein [Streptomyces pini]|uniref:Uncharacterized protein n=1 Tax=Streptomyces pini TaxID=1520580 RepID=A0A1I4C0P1_9ACTN|nr:hypothetical protein [Streptomyces pini]SFK73919.1 hypothetical protein SAMN05192584_108191 [Streptomyces pini]
MPPDHPRPDRRPDVRLALVALAAATVLAIVVFAPQLARRWTWHLLRAVAVGLLIAAYVLSLIS